MKMKITEQRYSMLHGVLLITLFACAAFYIGDMAYVKALSLSPMIVGIVLGMLYANSLRNNLPVTWVPGIAFCTKRILRELGVFVKYLADEHISRYLHRCHSFPP